LHDAWRDGPLDPRITEMIEDAQASLAAAAAWGLEWVVGASPLVADHPAELVGALLSSQYPGSLLVPAPGEPISRGAPAAFLAARRAGAIEPLWADLVSAFLDADAPPAGRPGPRQVYRQFDFARAGPVRDLVLPVAAGPAPGQPLLVWAIVDGAAQPVSLPPRRRPPEPQIPLVFAEAPPTQRDPHA
jgi:hypothetical protein